MVRDFRQLEWDAQLEDDCRQLVHLAMREDLARWQDWTTMALIAPTAQGKAAVSARQPGTAAGIFAVRTIIEEIDAQIVWQARIKDGERFAAGACLGLVEGTVRDLLVAERLLLNMLGRMCGVATQTARFVDAAAGSGVRIYDTRKTTPGWRRLEKYAVRCGGGYNHRTGLFDAILIKDNHLAFAGLAENPAEALARVRQFIEQTAAQHPELEQMLIEIEVDSLAQLQQVLPSAPNLILLDNMKPDQLRMAVALRNAAGVASELEASGGVTLASIPALAETGVERISAGALTHSAVSLDIGLDWEKP
jgi:nicotinate-nucleotide pyrophosphorylase (carboxylating)